MEEERMLGGERVRGFACTDRGAFGTPAPGERVLRYDLSLPLAALRYGIDDIRKVATASVA